MNTLLEKGLITQDEGDKIIKKSLPPEMTEEQKENVLNGMRTTNNG
jgi:hypothetical protein